MIRVVLPYHLRNLAEVGKEVTVAVAGPVTARTVLDALEARYPVLRGTIRAHGSGERRPFLRFFACASDLAQLRLLPCDGSAPDKPRQRLLHRGECRLGCQQGQGRSRFGQYEELKF